MIIKKGNKAIFNGTHCRINLPNGCQLQIIVPHSQGRAALQFVVDMLSGEITNGVLSESIESTETALSIKSAVCAALALLSTGEKIYVQVEMQVGDKLYVSIPAIHNQPVLFLTVSQSGKLVLVTHKTMPFWDIFREPAAANACLD